MYVVCVVLSEAVYPDGVVCMEMAHLLLFYLEGLATYVTKETLQAYNGEH